jgi:hypothetical protein
MYSKIQQIRTVGQLGTVYIENVQMRRECYDNGVKSS